MSDRELMKEARDAFARLHNGYHWIHDDDGGRDEGCHDGCEYESILTRLDSELAKVAEPVDNPDFDAWWNKNRARWNSCGVKQAREAWSESRASQPVVLDLRDVDRFALYEGFSFGERSLLAAIRAQLKDVVVKC